MDSWMVGLMDWGGVKTARRLSPHQANEWISGLGFRFHYPSQGLNRLHKGSTGFGKGERKDARTEVTERTQRTNTDVRCCKRDAGCGMRRFGSRVSDFGSRSSERGAGRSDASNFFTGLTLTNVWNIPVRAGFPRGRGKRRPGRARSPGPGLLASTRAARLSTK
jgi:hypothetical protein